MEQLTYAALILGWAAPVVVLHWAVGAKALIRRRRELVIAVAMATVYLGLADVAAIENGVWEINPEKTLPLTWGSFVFEEWLFFFVTNLMIAQTVVLAFDVDVQERLWRLIYRLEHWLPLRVRR